MKTNLKPLAVLAAIAVLAVTITGCPDPTTSAGGGDTTPSSENFGDFLVK